ncbi:YihY/virulence factor BrkB family protein [Entomobacter blattae]|nr:YihY/virulence factor BrkB family protein [Entomobacter blattae]
MPENQPESSFIPSEIPPETLPETSAEERELLASGLVQQGPAGNFPNRQQPFLQAVHQGYRVAFPWQIPFSGWKRVARMVFHNLGSDQTGLSAAGCAFYGTLSLIPSISALISLYGLLFDPYTVEPQLEKMRIIMPNSLYQMISQQIHNLLEQPHSTLTFNLFFSFMVTLWAASAGTKSILSALNIAYQEEEHRSFLHYQMTGLLMTIGSLLIAILTLALLVALPAMVHYLPLTVPYQLRKSFGVDFIEQSSDLFVRMGSLCILAVFVLFAFSFVFRYGPSRRKAKWRWVIPGALFTMILWGLSSYAFSIYVGRMANYTTTYGPLGTVAGVMMWFYVTAYAVVLGAELNAALELHVNTDTTQGEDRPMGKRQAYVADHVV